MKTDPVQIDRAVIHSDGRKIQINGWWSSPELKIEYVLTGLSTNGPVPSKK